MHDQWSFYILKKSRPPRTGLCGHFRTLTVLRGEEQLDFIRGAAASEGGKAVIALPSTAKEISRIVPSLKPGAAVTTSRNDVDHIITEYGTAALKGKTVRERMRALINIAHPHWRETLAQKAFEIYHVPI
jgi:acyl-CoA hydrolase